MSSTATSSQSATSQTRNKLDDYARWGIWALPVWTLLLFLGTLPTSPPTRPTSRHTPGMSPPPSS